MVKSASGKVRDLNSALTAKNQTVDLLKSQCDDMKLKYVNAVKHFGKVMEMYDIRKEDLGFEVKLPE